MDVLSNKQKFIEDLESYMTRIGRPIGKSPVMGYKELDLHQLFCEVMAHGGFTEVVKKVGTWARIWKRLDNFDASVTDASYRLKKNYERCLLDYESKRFPDHREFCQATLNTLQSSINSGNDKSNFQKVPKPRGFPKKSKQDNQLPQTPFLAGDFLIENFGTIIPKSPFINERFAYPVGYQCSTMFKSMTNPSTDVRYRMQIIDSDGIPQFLITSEDETILAGSPHQAWQIVLAKIAVQGSFPSISRVQNFGLDHPMIKQILQELPSASKAFDVRSNLRQSKKKRYSDDSESEEYLPSPKSPRTAPSPPSTSSSDEEVEKTLRIRFSRTPEKKEKSLVQPVLPVSFNFMNFGSTDEMDDMELAVHTLTSLKFSIIVK